jgi:ATP/maltotriose-dependent transcriptional regulator MalT
LDLARNYLTDCLESLKEQSATDLLSAAYETSARLFMQQQSFEEGLGFLKDGIKWAEAQRLERLKNKLVDELIVWLLRLQRRFEAEQYASQYDLILKTANDFEPSRTLHRVCARSIVYIWLDRERYDDAVAVLNQLLVKSREVNQQRKTVLFLSVLSIAERARGNKDVALATLRDAVLLASSQRYIRLLVDEPRLHAGIQEISQLRKNSESSLPDSGFIKSLVQKTASLTAEASPSVEPLTGKEMEIIQFLEGGLANKQIAAELFISEGTLKWHLHNIYSKLGVRNRTQALAEGRKQGYL